MEYDETKWQFYCHHCKENFVDDISKIETKYFNGYILKIIECPHCKKIMVISSQETENFNVNEDPRYYQY